MKLVFDYLDKTYLLENGVLPPNINGWLIIHELQIIFSLPYDICYNIIIDWFNNEKIINVSDLFSRYCVIIKNDDLNISIPVNSIVFPQTTFNYINIGHQKLQGTKSISELELNLNIIQIDDNLYEKIAHSSYGLMNQKFDVIVLDFYLNKIIKSHFYNCFISQIKTQISEINDNIIELVLIIAVNEIIVVNDDIKV